VSVAALAAAAGLALAAGWLRSPGSAEPAPQRGREAPRNLLLVTLDTTRADRIGCYGYERAHTPTLDALAARGALFEHCITPAPITLPSHATILTGLEPFSHGARSNGTHYLPPEVATLAERLSAAGFATGAVVSAFVLDSRFGLDQGFDRYNDDLAAGAGGDSSGFRETRADDTLRRARGWLEERGDEPWFLWVHLFDPHSDYAAPEPWATRFAASPYDGELAFVDAELGRFLEWLGERDGLDGTLVAVTSDHGESLGEHGERTHGTFVYDATTRVPLILAHSSIARGRRIAQVVASADVTPTVLELLGLEAPTEVDGRSLAPLVRLDAGELGARPAYSESMFPYYSYGWARLTALRDESWRRIHAPRPELYDLRADPGELMDVSGEHGAQAQRLDEHLDALLPDHEADARPLTGGGDDAEVRAALADLGYTLGADETPDESGRPDPKDRVREISRAQQAEGLRLAGRLAQAAELYRKAVADNPSAVPMRDALASILIELGEQAEALGIHRGSIALAGRRSDNFMVVADLERELGVGDWRDSLERAKTFDPRDPRPWVREAEFVHLPGDPEAALAAYRTALELDERHAPAWSGICRVEVGRRDLPAAISAGRKAVEADPGFARGWYELGALHVASNAPQQARPCLERARDLDAEDVQARVLLALTLQRLGDETAAVVELRGAWALDPTTTERLAASAPALTALLAHVR
jgi:arylsulfatase A-like enzyme